MLAMLCSKPAATKAAIGRTSDRRYCARAIAHPNPETDQRVAQDAQRPQRENQSRQQTHHAIWKLGVADPTSVRRRDIDAAVVAKIAPNAMSAPARMLSTNDVSGSVVTRLMPVCSARSSIAAGRMASKVTS